jgi:hypothetical protein
MTIQPKTRITSLTINGMISRNSPTACHRGRGRAGKIRSESGPVVALCLKPSAVQFETR